MHQIQVAASPNLFCPVPIPSHPSFFQQVPNFVGIHRQTMHTGKGLLLAPGVCLDAFESITVISVPLPMIGIGD